MTGAQVLTLLADQATPGSVVVPWWLRVGVLVYAALLIAAFMIYAQTKHTYPWNVTWALVIAFVPIAGAISYFIVQSLNHRATGAKPTKGRAETHPPEENHGEDTGSTGPRG